MRNKTSWAPAAAPIPTVPRSADIFTDSLGPLNRHIKYTNKLYIEHRPNNINPNLILWWLFHIKLNLIYCIN